jgi:DNA mismatch repair protein MutS
MSLTQDYINFYNNYKKQYGDNTIVLMMVGSFYEMYSVNGAGPDLYQISKMLNIQNTHKDKSKPESMSNPHTVGFQMNSFDKFLEMLTNNDYTVIVYDQKITLNPDAKKVSDQRVVSRYVSGIYTKGTYINNLKYNENNYLMCVYIVNEDQKNSSPLKSVGLSCVDLSTGQIYCHSAYSEKYDEYISLDETTRFINNMNPHEILIYYDNQSKIDKTENMKEYFFGYMNIDANKCRYYDKIDNKYRKISFQNEFFKNIYSNCDTLLSPIEQLNLENEPNATISLCLLFDFVYDKMPHLLKNVAHPNFCFDNAHLVLGNNAIYQLDIFESQQNSIYKMKYKSLFNVVNFTCTPLGERHLRNVLSSPYTNKAKLNNIYKLTQKMIDLELPEKIKSNLNSIRDIERLARKMELKIIRPYEIPLFISSYENIVNIINILLETDDFQSILKDENIIKRVKKFIKYVNKIFKLENLSMCIDFDFDKQIEIYNGEIHEDIDALNNDINSGTGSIELLRDVLFDLFPKTKKQSSDGKVLVKHNDKDGYYLKLTEKNAKILQQILTTKKQLVIGTKKINTSDLEFTFNKSTAKITIPSLNDHADNLEEYSETISKLYKKYYFEDIEAIFNDYSDLFKQCNELITKIDYLQSGATMAMTFGYCKPIIDEQAYGYVDAKALRHPIVERIIDYEYIPNDICIGNNEMKGMLLFGLNSSGKSVLMKAVGLSIIMSQAGLYVPATSFTFSPYKTLMTRISGNDNIYKGLSSFAVEMSEINSILKRSNAYTLIIGDEIARGTESMSANALVASTIIKLSKLKPTFIFTTHLHELMKVKSVTNISTVKAYHLQVSYDEKSKALIYNRILTEGEGETEYGIAVAKYMIQDNEFIDNATRIKNELLEINNGIISGKTSRYNKDLYVYECSLCKSPQNVKLTNLETHHINFQSNCDKNDVVKDKKHIKKNDLSNLVVLCQECHDKLHNNEIEITGYVKTSLGRQIKKNEK